MSIGDAAAGWAGACADARVVRPAIPVRVVERNVRRSCAFGIGSPQG
jgi:hypothetical protein